MSGSAKERGGKRENGMGSVFQTASGQWVAQVTDPETGKQKRKYAKSRNEAEKVLREMLNRAEKGQPLIDSRLPFGDYLDRWLDQRAGLSRSPSTLYEYRRRLAKHASPKLQRKALGRIRARDIELVLRSAAESGLSRASVTALRNALGAAFSDAVSDGLLAESPVVRAQMPRMAMRSTPRGIPTTNEVIALYRATQTAEGEGGAELGRILIVVMCTGARIGEVLAMKWSHVDLEAAVWIVQDTISRDELGRTSLGTQTKTGRDRDVQLAPEALDALQRQAQYVSYRGSMAPIWSDGDLVFPSAVGTPKDPRNLRRLLVEEFPEWNYTFHSLRHWFSSMGLLSAGVGITQVSRMLGHSSTRTTTDLYGHLLEEGSERVVGSISDTLRGDQDPA